MLSSQAFPVTPGDPFVLDVPMQITYESRDNGYVAIIFLDPDGRGVGRDILPFSPSADPVADTATDANGTFSVHLDPGSQGSYVAAFDGDSHHRPSKGYVR
jgi:hypothetical protein